MLLNFEQIAAASETFRLTRDMEVAEWGGTVRIRKLDAVAGMDLGQRFESIREVDGHRDPEALVEFYCVLLARSLVDEAGEPLFAGERQKLLRVQPLALLQRVGQAALEFNGFLAEDDDPN